MHAAILPAALAALAARKAKPSKHWAHIWQEEHARAFTVAQVASVRQLEWIKAALVKSLTEGMTARQFVKELAPRLQKAGWRPTGRGGSMPQRLERVLQINMRVSRAAGQWARVQRTKAVMPYLLYENGPSIRHRPDHVAWRGTLLPADDSWWNTHFPINGWGCKCRVRQVGKAEYARLKGKSGIKTKAPPIRYRLIDDPQGEVRKIRVPEGIDAGWTYNVGAAPWLGTAASVQTRAARLLAAPSPRASKNARRFIQTALAGEGFRVYATAQTLWRVKDADGNEIRPAEQSGWPSPSLARRRC